MFTVINQFKRIRSDHGQNDRTFEEQESRLKEALANLKIATDNLIRASQALSDILIMKRSKKLH